MTMDHQAYARWFEQQQQQQHQHQQHTYYNIEISGIPPQSYDTRATTVNVIPRTFLAPHCISSQTYSGPASTTLIGPQLQPQQNPFSYGSYTESHSTGLVSAYASNYIQRRPLPTFIASEVDSGRNLPYTRSIRQGYVEELHSQSPSVKSDPGWHVSATSPTLTSTSLSTNGGPHTPEEEPEGVFETEVDTLMKAIQAKAPKAASETNSPLMSSIPLHTPYQSGDSSESKLAHTQPKAHRGLAILTKNKKRYECKEWKGVPCGKSFNQKTHLDIHERKHSGEKPYPCLLYKKDGVTSCGRWFSQRGNLKTHERRHTGEKPFACQLCNKMFAQAGNVKSHMLTHGSEKGFECKVFDKDEVECGKTFTQLGNLKCHMNRFHKSALADLTEKFANLGTGDTVTEKEHEVFYYFANLFKNSNKGIKGRGKNNKVGARDGPMHVASMSGTFSGGRQGYEPGLGRYPSAAEVGIQMWESGSEGSAGTVYDDEGYEQQGSDQQGGQNGQHGQHGQHQGGQHQGGQHQGHHHQQHHW